MNIHKAENAERLKELEQLPDSCAASARCLERLRAHFEAQGVFSPSMIDGLIQKLEGYNDANLRQTVENDQAAMLNLVMRYFHCG